MELLILQYTFTVTSRFVMKHPIVANHYAMEAVILKNQTWTTDLVNPKDPATPKKQAADEEEGEMLM